MIKNLVIRTKEVLTSARVAQSQFDLLEVARQKGMIEAVAMSTSVVEDVLLANKAFINTYTNNEKDSIELLQILEINLVTKDSMNDIIAVLKHGDVAAKKRLLKELEEV